MIENFNNLFFLILHILVTGLFGLFTYRTLFAPHGLVKEWNLDANSGYIIRALGCFIAPFFLIGVYLLFRSAGPEGAWLYYNLVFLLGLFLTIYDTSYYLKLLSHLYFQLQ